VIESIAIAIGVGVLVGLASVFIGRMLKAAGVPPAEAAGGFLEQFAWALGFVAALWAFATGWRPF